MKALIGTSSRAALATLMLSNAYYGIPGYGRTTLVTANGREYEYALDNLESYYAVPDMPDTGYNSTRRTPFYNRSVKSGTPSELLTSMISRI